jgi:protein CMS1
VPFLRRPNSPKQKPALQTIRPEQAPDGAKTLTYQTPKPDPKMAPATEPTAAAAGRKRKKPDGPSKTLAKKPSGPKSTSGKKKKEKHKHTTHKEKKPQPTGPPAKQPAEPDQAAAGGGAAGGGVLLSAAMPPARQLEFLLRSFERAGKMRLSPLELDSYSGCSSSC